MHLEPKWRPLSWMEGKGIFFLEGSFTPKLRTFTRSSYVNIPVPWSIWAIWKAMTFLQSCRAPEISGKVSLETNIWTADFRGFMFQSAGQVVVVVRFVLFFFFSPDVTLGFQTPNVKRYLDPQNMPETPNLKRYIWMSRAIHHLCFIDFWVREIIVHFFKLPVCPWRIGLFGPKKLKP